MAVEISSTLQARLLTAAQATPAVEVCGLLFGDETTVVRVTACANVAADPARAFEIDPVALFAALRAERAGGARLIGYWHSHPNGSTTPSVTDAARAAADGKIWVIVAGGRIAAWRATEQAGATGFVPVTIRETLA
ncbi:M67 family metallopeptidase [Sphingomonas sp. TREG-RG-20F-R18-01]|uniref:M67 family metallopeptidase n=1 Tax=Sphingomonas sp. TREG-RG-20F-R18-01 TaxID=2914982 RepID=UPI003221A8A6